MYQLIDQSTQTNKRVRAILLTGKNTLMFIKRVKPHNPDPYWVAPGGGMESHDVSLTDTLNRELCEELGATATVLETAFVLHHEKAGKHLEEHFFICKLEDYDLSKRHGPEFDDPTRGDFIPVEIALDLVELNTLNIKTPEMREWIVNNLDYLRQLQETV